MDNLLVRIHCIIVMIRWSGLAPWEFEFPFPGSLTSTFLGPFVFYGNPKWGGRGDLHQPGHDEREHAASHGRGVFGRACSV